ncbi:MAG: NAD(P)/FAD-dependent oxidoreductase [Psittacicella sp.]
MTRIVIAGAGAGGIELATFLGKKFGKDKSNEIILINERSTHIWKPHLHEVAAGTLDTHFDTMNIPLLGKHQHFTFVQGTFTSVNRSKKEIILAPIYSKDTNELLVDTRTISYDVLVIAVGVVNNDFNTPGVNEYAYKLENVETALKVKQRIANEFLKLSLNKNNKGIDIAIVGAGPTGVELAAELKAAADDLCESGMPNITKDSLRINLLDAGPRILGPVREKLAEIVAKQLTDLNVTIKPQTFITEITETGIKTKSDEFIPSDLTIWAAGIKGAEFLKHLDGLETNRLNQLVVRKTLQTTEDDFIFAIGDCCACPMNEEGKLVPARAQAASQMAKLCTSNIEKLLKGQKLQDYVYHDHGTMISMSKFSSAGDAKYIGIVKGKKARPLYLSIYKMHQREIFGLCTTICIMIAKKFSRYKHSSVKLPK